MLQVENDVLKDELEENRAKTIPTMRDGKTINSAVRQCVYFCTTRQVSIRNISPVIRYCVEKLGGQKLGKLPDASTCERMVPEMRELSKLHIGEELASSTDTTLKYDGTSKKRRHFSEVQIANSARTFTVGIKEIPRGDADSYVDSINASIDSVSNTCKQPELTNNIINNIANTMTDRHIVNKSANQKLANTADTNINNFYCGMHPLDTFAKTADKTTKAWEDEMNPSGVTMSFKKRGCSAAFALIQAMCRLCFKDGAGLPTEIKAHLQMNGIKTNPLQSIMGSHFHVYFFNAGACFFLKGYILEFITKVWAPTNECLRAVKHDLETENCITACRALGLVGKYLTGPWMRLIESDVGILELNHYYCEAVETLRKWSHDATDVVKGCAPPIFEDISMSKDGVFAALTKPSSSDVSTCQLLQRLFHNIGEDCNRQLADQLPGGKYSQPDEELQRQAESCIGHNISGERVFGQLDFELKRAPSANITYTESKIMYRNNNTEEWLSSSAEKEVLLKTAREQAKLSHEDIQRQKHVDQLRKQQLEEKRNNLIKKDDDLRVSRETLLEDISRHGGLWKSEEEMNNNLKDKSKTQQMISVKLQLNVRKKIIQQKGSPGFYFTKVT